MSESPTYRIPIKVVGFIEIHDSNVSVKVDRYDWDYSGWPRINPYGTDDDAVVQVEVNGHRTLEADADLVEAVRARANVDIETKWYFTSHADEDIHTEHDDE